jgi:hypothetical protein
MTIVVVHLHGKYGPLPTDCRLQIDEREQYELIVVKNLALVLLSHGRWMEI